MEIKKFGLFFLLGIILVLAFKFYTIISGFIPAMASGCVLAYLFNPVYLYLRKITKRETFAASIITFIIIALILVPVTFIITTVQKQMHFVFTETTITSIQDIFKNIDTFLYDKAGIKISEEFTTEIYSRLISIAQETITAFGPKMIVNIAGFILFSFLAIFIMYYLLKNSEKVIHTFGIYFPLRYKNIDILLDEIGKKTKTLIFGQLLIAVIQGSVGALGFFLFGISGVLLWGLIMVIMSFLPVLGPAIIWFPAGIILLIKEEYFNGIGILLWGFIIISTIDNVIRPKLTSSLGQIHPVTVLLGVFIGLKEWGVIGLIIGPIFISILVILIKMFREEYIEE